MGGHPSPASMDALLGLHVPLGKGYSDSRSPEALSSELPVPPSSITVGLRVPLRQDTASSPPPLQVHIWEQGAPSS